MALSRISRPILQILLGLLFLAWLPAMEAAAAESPFLFQVEEALSLSDLSDSGEAERGEGIDGEGSRDALILPHVIGCSSAEVHGKSIHQNVAGKLHPADFLSVRHATGPPSFSN